MSMTTEEILFIVIFGVWYFWACVYYPNKQDKQKKAASETKAQALQRRRNHHRALANTAKLEHELGFLPHQDPDIKKACPVTSCNLPKAPSGPAPGARVNTPNEIRAGRKSFNVAPPKWDYVRW